MKAGIAAVLAVLGLAAQPGAPAGQTAGAPARRVLAGRVLAIEGTAQWRPDARTAPAALQPPGLLDIRRLHAGDHIRCDPGSRIRIEIYGRTLTIEEWVGWYPIPHVPGRLGVPDYGEPGGRLLHVPRPPPRNVG